jgi:uncharacterized protein YbbC (DUF1343 family)
VSLYGPRLSPTPEHLSGIDLLLVDLQDVGCRVYTYIWTLLLAMEACARAGVEVVVLDRPNPLGRTVEGPLLEEGLYSFVGLLSIPMRHGLTIGELALYFKNKRRLDLPLRVLKVEGWRGEPFPETGLPWIMPSPNMPSFETALVYPGQVLLEGTNLSEGRGTTRPFEIFGAPYLSPEKLRPFSAKIPNIGDWFYLPTWKQAFHSDRFSESLQLPYAMKWLVFSDRVGIGKQMIKILRLNEQQVIEVEIGTEHETRAMAGNRPIAHERHRLPVSA